MTDYLTPLKNNKREFRQWHCLPPLLLTWGRVLRITQETIAQKLLMLYKKQNSPGHKASANYLDLWETSVSYEFELVTNHD